MLARQTATMQSFSVGSRTSYPYQYRQLDVGLRMTGGCRGSPSWLRATRLMMTAFSAVRSPASPECCACSGQLRVKRFYRRARLEVCLPSQNRRAIAICAAMSVTPIGGRPSAAISVCNFAEADPATDARWAYSGHSSNRLRAGRRRRPIPLQKCPISRSLCPDYVRFAERCPGEGKTGPFFARMSAAISAGNKSVARSRRRLPLLSKLNSAGANCSSDADSGRTGETDRMHPMIRCPYTPLRRMLTIPLWPQSTMERILIDRS